MIQQIIPIRLSLPLKITTVNCYLIKSEVGFCLIDTGLPKNRRLLEKTLERHECHPGNLRLVLLTHGDFDHTGNAVYLRKTFGSPIAMHIADAGMLENGDMFWNRKVDNQLIKGLMQRLIPIKKENQGKPDILLKDGDTLSTYGLDSTVLNTPGHSAGSICILTAAGELFCGDLFINSSGKATLNSMLYDHPAGKASLERLKSFPIQIVYPGHGPPFNWSAIKDNNIKKLITLHTSRR